MSASARELGVIEECLKNLLCKVDSDDRSSQSFMSPV